MSTSHDQIHSRTLGALLGVHAGDSLGATLEFKSWSTISKSHRTGLREIVGGGPFNWAAGAATDDTDLTRAVLLAYRDLWEEKRKTDLTDGPENEQRRDFDVTKAAAEYAVNWLEGSWPGRKPGSRPEDIGNATAQGLALYKRTRDPSKAGAGIGSAGNGSLMRCIPTALFAAPENRRRESVAISEFTHNDPRCTVSCAVYNEMVAALVAGKAPVEAVEAGKQVAREMGEKRVLEAIGVGEQINLEKVAKEGTRKHNVTPSGYVLSSLRIAVAAVLDGRGFEDVLVDVVRLGGDADTNGAIAGGLLGAKEGVESIPERWRVKLQFGKEFEEVVGRILELKKAG